MTPELSYFRELDQSYKSKLKIGNGDLVDVKGKGVVAIETPIGIKYISNGLFVPKINQSLLSVGQMLEKNYSLHFQNMSCTVVDESVLWHKRFGHFHMLHLNTCIKKA